MVWFIGDLSNFFGAIWAGLVPTVIALSIYFIIADSVLITQCLYYNHINACKSPTADVIQGNIDDPQQPLLGRRPSDIGLPGSRRRSSISIKRRDSSHGTSLLSTVPEEERYAYPWFINTLCVLAICAVGFAAWVIAWQVHLWVPTPEDLNSDDSKRSVGAEILGYLSAIF